MSYDPAPKHVEMLANTKSHILKPCFTKAGNIEVLILGKRESCSSARLYFLLQNAFHSSGSILPLIVVQVCLVECLLEFKLA